MSNIPSCLFTPDPWPGRLANDIRSRHRGLLKDLRLEDTGDGLVLHGVACSFYGKQVALHEVRRLSGRLVRANRIAVE